MHKTPTIDVFTMNTKEAAAVLGKAGRQRNTPAQAEASRRNGKRGGRPIRTSTDKIVVDKPERSG